MVESRITRARFFVSASAVGFGGFVIGASTTFILGLSVTLISGVILSSPTAVIGFMGGYPLTFLLLALSSFAGMILLVRRVHAYLKKYD